MSGLKNFSMSALQCGRQLSGACVHFGHHFQEFAIKLGTSKVASGTNLFYCFFYYTTIGQHKVGINQIKTTYMSEFAQGFFQADDEDIHLREAIRRRDAGETPPGRQTRRR